MRKSKCKHCTSGVVLNQECNKVISYRYCELDQEEMCLGCTPEGCRYYERKKENEEEQK